MAFGSMNSDKDNAPLAEINVTPLVDVMLVLLIVFMITLPVLTHSIPITLPTSKEAEAKNETPTKPLHIEIDQDGQYQLDGKAIDLAGLEATLKERKADDPEVVLAVSADKHVAYDYVAKVLDAARSNQIGKVGFVTKAEQ